MPELGYINEYYKVGNKMIMIMNSTKDITAGTEFYLHAKKPNGEEITYTGVLNGDSSVQGEVPGEDNDQAGTWKFDASVVIDGETYRFGTGEEIVLAHFQSRK